MTAIRPSRPQLGGALSCLVASSWPAAAATLIVPAPGAHNHATSLSHPERPGTRSGTGVRLAGSGAELQLALRHDHGVNHGECIHERHLRALLRRTRRAATAG